LTGNAAALQRSLRDGKNPQDINAMPPDPHEIPGVTIAS
jgi:hypothetical protein